VAPWWGMEGANNPAGGVPIPEVAKKVIPPFIRGPVVFFVGVTLSLIVLNTIRANTDFDVVEALTPNLRKLLGRA